MKLITSSSIATILLCFVSSLSSLKRSYYYAQATTIATTTTATTSNEKTRIKNDKKHNFFLNQQHHGHYGQHQNERNLRHPRHTRHHAKKDEEVNNHDHNDGDESKTSWSDLMNNLFTNIKGPKIEKRIIGGGTVTTAGDFPFFVDLQLGCGGSLISSNLVLTAAHCLTQEWNENVYVGAIERGFGVHRKMSTVSIHPLYESTEKIPKYDFAIMRLSESIIIDNNSSIQPILLNRNPNLPNNANVHYSPPFTTTTTDLVVIGMGDTKAPPVTTNMTRRRSSSQNRSSSSSIVNDNLLQKLSIPYVNYNICSSIYEGMIDEESMICAGGKFKQDSCQGDSGSPLMDTINGIPVQVGIVSFGFKFCGQSNKPGIYSRITSAIDWIDQHICMHHHTNNDNPLPQACQNYKPITFKITYDSFPEETSWTLKNTTNGETLFIVPRKISIDNNIGQVNTTTTTTIFNLKPGLYTFEIEDSLQDGICCEYGEGKYEIMKEGEASTIKRMGTFTGSDSIKLEVLESGRVIDAAEAERNDRFEKKDFASSPNILDVYSNAVNNSHQIRVDIICDDRAEDTQWKITDVSTRHTLILVPFRTYFPWQTKSTTVHLLSGTYEFEIEDAGKNGISMYGIRPPVALYEIINNMDFSTTEIPLAKHEGNFGASTKFVFKL